MPNEYGEDDSQRERETERWRGQIGANLEHVKENVRSTANMVGTLVKKIEDGEKETDKRFRDLEVKVQTMATRLAIYTGIAAFLGSGIMSTVVALLLAKK